MGCFKDIDICSHCSRSEYAIQPLVFSLNSHLTRASSNNLATDQVTKSATEEKGVNRETEQKTVETRYDASTEIGIDTLSKTKVA